MIAATARPGLEMGASTPPTGAMALTKRHATGLAKFILESFADQGEATKEDCVELLGADSSRCDAFTD